MKYIVCLLMTAALLTGCSAGAGMIPAPQTEEPTAAVQPSATPIFDFLGADYVAWRDSYNADSPVSLTITSGGSGEPLVITDADDIYAVFDALAQLYVGERAALDASPSDSVTYAFAQTDGAQHSLSFNSGCLDHDGGYYLVSGTEAIEATGLWGQLTDPASAYAGMLASEAAEGAAQLEKNVAIANEVNENSSLGPGRLLMTEREAGNLLTQEGEACSCAADDYILAGGELIYTFSNYPVVDYDFVLTTITIASHDYHVLGVTVGDALSSAQYRLAEFDFVPVDDKFEFVREGVSIYCECEGGIITQLIVSVG